jgi:hypothetical protein
MRRTIARALTAGAALTVLAGIVSPASAAVAANPGFGGYIVRGPTADTARVRARIVSLPTFSCTNETRNGSALLGAHLAVTSADASLWAAIEMNCVNLTPTYTAAYSTGGATTLPAMTVSPGDKIEFLLVASPTGENVYLSDLTTGAKAHGNGTTNYGSSTWNASYGVINELAHTLIPQFATPIAWSQVAFDGAAIGSQSAAASNLTRADGSAVVLVRTSPLSPQGKFFKNTWVRSH